MRHPPASQPAAAAGDFTGEVVVGLGSGMPFCLRVADVLTLHAGEQHELDLSRYVRADSRVSLTLDWSGVCALRPRPLALDAQARQGWYAREILREVLDLTWQPVSSLKLVNPDFDLNYLFGQGMAFSRLDHWVISQQPTLTLTLDRWTPHACAPSCQQARQPVPRCCACSIWAAATVAGMCASCISVNTPA